MKTEAKIRAIKCREEKKNGERKGTLIEGMKKVLTFSSKEKRMMIAILFLFFFITFFNFSLLFS